MDVVDLIEIFTIADRIGSDEDIPEGSRYIQLSETLVDEIILSLEGLPV